MSVPPYASLAYARVFEDSAQPLYVEDWKTHLLVRDIPEARGRDAIGCYPIAVFGQDADLAKGVEWLKQQGLVAVGLVPDPFTAPPASELAQVFPLCVQFKTHCIVDYAKEVRYSKHHRYEVKRAHERVRVEQVNLADHVDAWTALYGDLIDRHQIDGLARLSKDAFQRLLLVDGLTTVAAFVEQRVVSMHLWLTDPVRRAAYSLLAASDREGYALGAAYAVYDASIRLFSDLEVLSLGAGAGLSSSEDDGLTRFKSGFANAEVQAYFCGVVLDSQRYAALTGNASATAVPFPTYRFTQA